MTRSTIDRIVQLHDDAPPEVITTSREPADAVEVTRRDGTSSATPSDPAGDGESEDACYQARLGARLRAVRRSQGLRLQDVEERSDGRFKAVVVGSYERGDRAVSAHKLAAMAAFYGVSVADLLPDDDRAPGRPEEQSTCIAVDRLRAASDPELTPLVRLVHHVQWMRGDQDGQRLVLREDDLRTVAVALGVDPEHLDEWLALRGLLAR